MLIVEPARSQDLPAVDRLASRELMDWSGSESLLGAANRDSLLVARQVETGDVVGFAFARREAPCVGHVLALAVGRQHQREGIGSALLRQVGRQMARSGALCLCLEVRRDDRDAQAFYERHGFEPYGLVDRPYQDGTEALRLERPL